MTRWLAARGLKTVPTGQRFFFFEGFEAVQALARGHVRLERLVPGATPHERARAVVHAVNALGARLRRAA